MSEDKNNEDSDGDSGFSPMGALTSLIAWHKPGTTANPLLQTLE